MPPKDRAAQGAPPGGGGDDDGLPAPRPRARERKFATFVKTLLLRRRRTVPLDSLRLCWDHETVHGDANTWVAQAVRHGAEEIELSAKHHYCYPSPEYMSFIAADKDTFKIRLKVLKFVYIRLDATTLTQLCSRCTCLEELELKDCQISQASKIRSTMLKRLTMIRCRILKGLSGCSEPWLTRVQQKLWVCSLDPELGIAHGIQYQPTGTA